MADERVLIAGDGIRLVDGGPGKPVEIQAIRGFYKTEEEYESGQCIKATHYVKRAGVFVCDWMTVYTYSGSKLLSEDCTEYDAVGNVTNTRTATYSTVTVTKTKTLQVREES